MSNDTLLILITTLSSLLAIAAIYQLIISKKKLKRYSAISDLDDACEKLRQHKKKITATIEDLTTLHEKLRKECDFYTDSIDLISYGFYKPKYDYEDSRIYKEELEEITSEQKELIREKMAIDSNTEWQVEGSKAKGRVMINRIIKLALNAYNVQCDNTILKVKFNNMIASQKRLEKIKDNINKLLEPNHCNITDDFHDLKKRELDLSFEYQEKLQEEKEEQRRIREQMREEEKVKRDIEKAKMEAEKDEKLNEAAIVKAKKDLEGKSDAEKLKYEAIIKELEGRLEEAHQKKERAISQAEKTKRGHVYVISNIGSFGDKIYKIGVTRRLEPMDRVKELGDASVPFSFDVHGMIFSDNAPELETKLHQKFKNKRVNKINTRKEFFKVNLEEIQKECEKFDSKIELTKVAEAKDFRETQALIEEETKKAQASAEEKIREKLKNSQEDDADPLAEFIVEKAS